MNFLYFLKQSLTDSTNSGFISHISVLQDLLKKLIMEVVYGK